MKNEDKSIKSDKVQDIFIEKERSNESSAAESREKPLEAFSEPGWRVSYDDKESKRDSDIIWNQAYQQRGTERKKKKVIMSLQRKMETFDRILVGIILTSMALAAVLGFLCFILLTGFPNESYSISGITAIPTIIDDTNVPTPYPTLIGETLQPDDETLFSEYPGIIIFSSFLTFASAVICCFVCFVLSYSLFTVVSDDKAEIRKVKGISLSVEDNWRKYEGAAEKAGKVKITEIETSAKLRKKRFPIIESPQVKPYESNRFLQKQRREVVDSDMELEQRILGSKL
eukprot:augustus_masked-scaffold_13-processed-gene-4.16-mRNA-1 protein AED:1.00 eAED:1.00 QI:0/-1/0/0/-1/1/1/0/285